MNVTAIHSRPNSNCHITRTLGMFRRPSGTQHGVTTLVVAVEWHPAATWSNDFRRCGQAVERSSILDLHEILI